MPKSGEERDDRAIAAPESEMRKSTRAPARRAERRMTSEISTRAKDSRARDGVGDFGDWPLSSEQFGADAVPLRPAAERNAEAESDERLRMISARPRWRSPLRRRRGSVVIVVAVGLIGLAAVTLWGPGAGGQRSSVAAKGAHPLIPARPELQRRHLAVGDAVSVASAPISQAGRLERGRPARARRHLRRANREKDGRTGRAVRAGDTGVPAPEPEAVPEPESVPTESAPEPVSEPPPAPAPAPPDPGPPSTAPAPAPDPEPSPSAPSVRATEQRQVESEFGFEQ